MVRHAVRARVAAALAATALAGCGGGDPGSRSDGEFDVSVRLAACSDWNAADVGERYDAVEKAARFAGGPTGSPAGRGRTLDRETAYRLFERACAPEFARSFKLYKLYTRAAAFSRR